MKSDREKKFGNAWKYTLVSLIFIIFVDLEDAGVFIPVVVLVLLVFGLGWLISKAVRRRRSEARQAVQTAPQNERESTYSPESFDVDECDRRKRIEQLDGFLENGLIDREEYRRMKERYEKR